MPPQKKWVAPRLPGTRKRPVRSIVSQEEEFSKRSKVEKIRNQLETDWWQKRSIPPVKIEEPVLNEAYDKYRQVQFSSLVPTRRINQQTFGICLEGKSSLCLESYWSQILNENRDRHPVNLSLKLSMEKVQSPPDIVIFTAKPDSRIWSFYDLMEDCIFPRIINHSFKKCSGSYDGLPLPRWHPRQKLTISPAAFTPRMKQKICDMAVMAPSGPTPTSVSTIPELYESINGRQLHKMQIDSRKQRQFFPPLQKPCFTLLPSSPPQFVEVPLGSLSKYFAPEVSVDALVTPPARYLDVQNPLENVVGVDCLIHKELRLFFRSLQLLNCVPLEFRLPKLSPFSCHQSDEYVKFSMRSLPNRTQLEIGEVKAPSLDNVFRRCWSSPIPLQQCFPGSYSTEKLQISLQIIGRNAATIASDVFAESTGCVDPKLLGPSLFPSFESVLNTFPEHQETLTNQGFFNLGLLLSVEATKATSLLQLETALHRLRQFSRVAAVEICNLRLADFPDPAMRMRAHDFLSDQMDLFRRLLQHEQKLLIDWNLKIDARSNSVWVIVDLNGDPRLWIPAGCDSTRYASPISMALQRLDSPDLVVIDNDLQGAELRIQLPAIRFSSLDRFALNETSLVSFLHSPPKELQIRHKFRIRRIINQFNERELENSAKSPQEWHHVFLRSTTGSDIGSMPLDSEDCADILFDANSCGLLIQDVHEASLQRISQALSSYPRVSLVFVCLLELRTVLSLAKSHLGLSVLREVFSRLGKPTLDLYCSAQQFFDRHCLTPLAPLDEFQTHTWQQFRASSGYAQQATINLFHWANLTQRGTPCLTLDAIRNVLPAHLHILAKSIQKVLITSHRCHFVAPSLNTDHSTLTTHSFHGPEKALSASVVVCPALNPMQGPNSPDPATKQALEKLQCRNSRGLRPNWMTRRSSPSASSRAFGSLMEVGCDQGFEKVLLETKAAHNLNVFSLVPHSALPPIIAPCSKQSGICQEDDFALMENFGFEGADDDYSSTIQDATDLSLSEFCDDPGLWDPDRLDNGDDCGFLADEPHQHQWLKPMVPSRVSCTPGPDGQSRLVFLPL